MSWIKIRDNWICSMMRSILQDVKPKQTEVRLVRPLDNCASDDQSNIETEHLKTYRAIWNIIESLAYIVGVSALKECEMNYRLVATTSLIVFGYFVLFYTMAVVWPSVPTLLEVICIFGVLVPATLKFRLVVKEAKRIICFNEFFEKIVTINAKGRRADHLSKEMINAFKNVKIFMAISLLCFAVFALYPLYGYVNDSRLIPIMRMEFPFLDQTTSQGYFIGFVIMFFLAVMAVVGSVAFDLLFLVILMEYGSLVTQFMVDLDEYHEIWKNTESFSVQYQKMFLKNICLKYQDLMNYIRYFDKLFAANTAQSIGVLYGSLICAVYAVFNNGWISGYGFCIFCFVQLYIPCILGTYVNNQNFRLNQAIYFTSWYEYPIYVQKIILVLLHASSFNTKELWIGHFAPLNVQTALQITKSIYSYYTAMSNLE